jgi:transcriptional regulator with XRE-family HTH domain
MRNNQPLKEALETYVSTAGSAAKAATKLGISSAQMSNIRNGRFDLVSDNLLRKISHDLGLKQAEWIVVDTKPLTEMKSYLEACKKLSMNLCICAPAGSGKKESRNLLQLEMANVFIVSCEEHWNKKNFLQELLSTMGIKYEGMTTHELVKLISDHLSKIDKPLLILDEADKLRDEILYFYITLYNRLEDRCGIAMLATDYLKKKILKGLALNRKGYQEIYSRIGRRFVEIAAPDANDIAKVCIANGVIDHREIERIAADSNGDMRRVRRHVLRVREQQLKAASSETALA